MHDNNIEYYKNVNKKTSKNVAHISACLAENKKPGKIPGFII